MIAELPLFIFTLSAGLAAGSYTIGTVFRIKGEKPSTGFSNLHV